MAAPARSVKILILILASGAALLVGGSVGGAVLWNVHHHQVATRGTTTPVAVKLPPILEPSSEDPIDGIYPQGPEATVIRAGFAQMVVCREGLNLSFNFTYQNRAGSQLDILTYTALSRLRQDKALQERIALTPDQLTALHELKLQPVFPEAERTRLHDLWMQYITAGEGEAKATTRAVLLAQLHKAGEELVPAMQDRLVLEKAVLTPEQLAILDTVAKELISKPGSK